MTQQTDSTHKKEFKNPETRGPEQVGVLDISGRKELEKAVVDFKRSAVSGASLVVDVLFSDPLKS